MLLRRILVIFILFHQAALGTIRVTWNNPVKNACVLKAPAGRICNSFNACMQRVLSDHQSVVFDTMPAEPGLYRICNGALFAEVFIDPDADNSFIISTPDSLRNNPLPNQLPAVLAVENNGHLHAKIQLFVSNVEAFMLRSSLQSVYPRTLGKAFLLWKKEQLALFPDTIGYFHDFMQYTLASMEEPFFQNRSYLFDTYIKNSAMQIQQPAWVSFFKSYYKKELDRVRVGSNRFDFREEVNQVSNYSHLRDAFLLAEGGFPKRLLDFFLLCQLFEACYDKSYDRQGIIRVLHSAAQELKDQTLIAEAKEIANSIAYTLPGFQYNKPASFPSVSQGKNPVPYFIFFWADWNPASLINLQQYKRISAVYGKKYKFVAIHSGNKERYEESMKTFSKEVIHLHDEQGGIMEQFRVAKFPGILLLNDEFRLINYTMPLPAEGLEDWIKAESVKKKN